MLIFMMFIVKKALQIFTVIMFASGMLFDILCLYSSHIRNVLNFNRIMQFEVVWLISHYILISPYKNKKGIRYDFALDTPVILTWQYYFFNDG